MEREPQKARPKLKKYAYIYREYLLLSNASGSFLQKCIRFEEQRLKFPHFERYHNTLKL